MAVQQKAFQLVQSGADVAEETSVATNIQPGITMGAWELKAIELTIKPILVKAWAAVDSDFTVQFMKRSLAGAVARVATYTDTDLIASMNWAINAAGTPASLGVIPCTFFIELPDGIIVYSENLYVQMISTATGAANSIWGRILYEPRTLTQSEALVIVASRP